MKRLQVGDECYVRDVTNNEIYKCHFAIDCDGSAHTKRAKPISEEWAFCFDDEEFPHRLVYPYPIIKQLAK